MIRAVALAALAALALPGVAGGQQPPGHGGQPPAGHGSPPPAAGHAPAATAAPAPDAPPAIGMRGKVFAPGHVTVLAGQTITWVNDDGTAHDIATDDDAVTSGRMEPGARFSATFATQGRFPYLCTLHVFMRGQIDVFGLALHAPPRPVAPGHAAALSGLGPAGVEAIAVEERGADGAYRAVASVSAAADGTFRAQVAPAGPAVYRARAGELLSRDVRVVVSARLRLRATRHGERIVLRASATPAQPGARVALQRYVRNRFDWRTVARGRFDRRSTVTFQLRSRRFERFRLVEPYGTRGYGPARSPAVAVPTDGARSHRSN